VREETANKKRAIHQIWERQLRQNYRTSANSLIKDARERGLSYARRQILLRDIRDLRQRLKLPERTMDPPPTPEDEQRGGHVGTIIRYEEKSGKPLTRKYTVHERHLKRLNKLIEKLGVERAYEVMGIERETH
jgi:hypothetical protein